MQFQVAMRYPPVFDCDPDTRCCEEYFTATLGVSRTLKAEKKFGPAGCEFHIGAGLEGSATTSESEGPGCDCPGNKDTLKATLTADAGGECKVEMFGLKVGAGGSLTGGACAGKVIAGGCEEGGGWFAGTFVEVKVGPVSFGWLGSFEYSKKWESGDDC